MGLDGDLSKEQRDSVIAKATTRNVPALESCEYSGLDHPERRFAVMRDPDCSWPMAPGVYFAQVQMWETSVANAEEWYSFIGAIDCQITGSIKDGDREWTEVIVWSERPTFYSLEYATKIVRQIESNEKICRSWLAASRGLFIVEAQQL